MDNNIGSKGGVNDRRRSLVISQRLKKKLIRYYRELRIKELEKKVRKKQIFNLIRVLPIAIVGQSVKVILGSSKKKVIPIGSGNVTVRVRDRNNLVEKDNIVLEDDYNKLKAKKIVDVYSNRLKEIRYELRSIVYDYSKLEGDSEEIVVPHDASVLLDKLSLLIDRLDSLKEKINVKNYEEYDDNYVYYLVEEYIEQFKDNTSNSSISDSPLYIDISNKIDELYIKRDKLENKVREKKEKLEEREDKNDELEDREDKRNNYSDKYYDIDRINNDLMRFQYDQERILKDIESKVNSASSESIKTKIKVEGMSSQSRAIMNMLSMELFFPGPKVAKRMAATASLYLYFLNNIMRPKSVRKKYRVIRVKDYSDSLDANLDSIDSASNLLKNTKGRIDKMIDDVNREYGSSGSDIVNNLRRIKSSLDEKEFEMNKLRSKNLKLLSKNNNKVLTKGEYLM